MLPMTDTDMREIADVIERQYGPDSSYKVLTTNEMHGYIDVRGSIAGLNEVVEETGHVVVKVKADIHGLQGNEYRVWFSPLTVDMTVE